MKGRAFWGMAICFLIAMWAGPLYGGQSAGGEWVDLFNGRDLTGWKLVNPKGTNGWRVENGVYINQTPSTNLVTEKLFKDFDLHCEFQVPPRSNAGIYILNCYEVQIFDDYNRPIHSHLCGSMYGEITPSANACKPPAKDFPKIADNEWQTFDVNFRAARYGEDGRKREPVRVTVVHNGVKIIDNAELKTPTGAARRRDEEAIGPILLQADHGPVAFRSFRIRGQMYDPPDPKAPGPDVIGLEVQPRQMPENKAPGLALTWQTPNHAFASAYEVYRGESADFPLDKSHLRGTAIRRSFDDCCFETDAAYYFRIVAKGVQGVAGKPSAFVSAPGKANQVRTPHLSDATWARYEGESAPTRNRAASGKPMTMKGRRFDKGIGMRSPASLRFYVGEMVGPSDDYRFRATVGLDDSTAAARRATAAARFLVRLDDRAVFDSGPMKVADGTKDIDVAVPAGSRKLELIVQRAGEPRADYSNWGDPRLERAGRSVAAVGR